MGNETLPTPWREVSPHRQGEGQWYQTSDEWHRWEDSEGGGPQQWQRLGTEWTRPPEDHPSLPRGTEGPFTGWEKRHNIYTGSPDCKLELVGVWIDPANSQKSWGNLRAAVAHKNRERQEAQAQGS